MLQEDKKQILDKLQNELKESIHSKHFTNSDVIMMEGTYMPTTWFLLTNKRFEQPTLAFYINTKCDDDVPKLVLRVQYAFASDGKMICKDQYYSMEVDVDNIINAHKIFINDGPGKYGDDSTSMQELLKNHIEVK